MDKKIITILNIDISDILETGAVRQFEVRGDVGSKFQIIVSNNSRQFYNFSTNTFTENFTINSVSNITMSSTIYGGFIKFPAAAGASYNVLLIPDTDTTTTSSGSVINKRINQLGNTTVTFALIDTLNPGKYKTFPSSVTSTGSPASTTSTPVSIDWTVENVDTDADGFGFFTIFNPKAYNDKLFKTIKTHTVNGSTSSSFTVILDDISDITLGSILVGVSSGSLNGTPVIKLIDTATKQITLSGTSGQSFADGITLTFHTASAPSIQVATGLGFTLNRIGLQAITSPTTTVRGSHVNATTINLNGTYHISGGDEVKYTGTNVDNSSTNTVTSVSASATQGSMIVTHPQRFSGGETLTFRAVDDRRVVLSDTSRFTGTVTIDQYPSEDVTVYLDLALLIAHGSAS
jgi:hypothetical protein